MAHLRGICEEFFAGRDRQLGELQNEIDTRLREVGALLPVRKHWMMRRTG